MKKFITSLSTLLLAISVCSQEIVKDKKYYMDKSLRQKNGARVMLVAGGVLIGGGLLVGNGNKSSFGDAAAGGLMGIAGLGLMVGSVVVFTSSAKNKKRAMSLALENMPVQQIKNSSWVSQPIPAVSIKLNF